MDSNRHSDSSGIRDHALVEMLEGTELGGFRIDGTIGAGGMGTVFRATQLSIGRTVAVKVIREHSVPNGAERFLREARLISQINHPNVVQLIDFGHQDGLMYYAMEHIDGVPLDRLVSAGRLHPKLVVELAMQACSALAEAHAAGVVHRDLKASNMLVSITADGTLRLRVLDFGIARSFEDSAKLTQTGRLCGTPHYMAPEQARGEDPSTLVDLYALGINLHHMMAGEIPFSGQNAITIVVKQMQDKPPDLSIYAERSLIPETLVELTRELLSKEPARRPSPAPEVRRRLASIGQEFGWGPVEVSPASVSTLTKYWTRPPLHREVDAEVPDTWRFGDADLGPTDPIMPSDAVEKEAERRAPTITGPLPVRSGGGWSAFNRTPSVKSVQGEAMVISPVTGEYMSVSADDPDAAKALAPKEQRPASSVPVDADNRRARTFSEEELVVDLPPRPTATAPPPEPEPDSGVDLIKLIGTALIVFVLVLGIMFLVTSDSDAPPPPDIDVPKRSLDAIKVEPIIEEPQDEDGPSNKSNDKRPTRDEPAVIDVFDDAEDAPGGKRRIIIEEGEK